MRLYSIAFTLSLSFFVCLACDRQTQAQSLDSPANLVEIDARQQAPEAHPISYHGGTSTSPNGKTIGVTNRYLTLNGRPWLPVMGEFHYSRVPPAEWEDEILKMKAGGVQIISTYIFWNHVEEIQGTFDWSGQRDLRGFVQLCAKHGMYVYPRIGPWAHGESRYGGLPDWVMDGSTPRTTDPRFLNFVDTLYRQIGRQLEGLLWKDGGPVLGIQIENEYSRRGPNAGAAYLLQLKKIAVVAGLDVPLYTVTGWDNAVIPDGEFLPVYGAYPDAPWDTKPGKLPPNEAYLFRFQERASGNMGAIAAAAGPDGKQSHTDTPFLTAEVGAGMQNTYFRRPVVSADDVAAMVPTLLGSGVNLLGYYMFQGGQNPDGQRTTLNESRSTGYPTDVPVKNYDFQAPLSEYGLERPSYRKLKLFNYFLDDFGSTLAPTTVHAPRSTPSGPADLQTPRVSARMQEDHGFLFLNNHVRDYSMSELKDFQVRLLLPGETMLIPERPLDIPSNSYFVWPVNMDLDGLRLRFSTAQPLCRMVHGDQVLYVFSVIPGVPAQLSFDPSTSGTLHVNRGTSRKTSHNFLVTAESGTTIAIEAPTRSGKLVQIIVLTRQQAESLTRVSLPSGQHLVLSPQQVFSDGNQMTVQSLADPAFHLSVWPALNDREESTLPLTKTADDGLFPTYAAHAVAENVQPAVASEPATLKTSIAAGDLTTVPSDAQVAVAPRWRISVPTSALSLGNRLFMRIDYRGDIARLTAGEHLLADDFYNGEPWIIGLGRFQPQLAAGPLTLTIVPWRDPSALVLENTAKAKLEGLAPRLLNVSIEPEYRLSVR